MVQEIRRGNGEEGGRGNLLRKHFLYGKGILGFLMHPPWCVSRVFFHEGQKKGELEMAGREGKWWKGEEREIRGRGTVCPSR